VRNCPGCQDIAEASCRAEDLRPKTDEQIMKLRRTIRAAGFTLIELMVVLAIITILLSFAAPQYQQSILHAKEAALKDDLYTMRQAIDEYTLDKQRAPQALDDVVQAGYLKNIPRDPITNSSETWQVVNEDTLMSVDQTQPGITDVHSGATETSSDGSAYSSW
jgi:general secretion pathway protein G